jgi:hypothetical protein
VATAVAATRAERRQAGCEIELLLLLIDDGAAFAASRRRRMRRRWEREQLGTKRGQNGLEPEKEAAREREREREKEKDKESERKNGWWGRTNGRY